MSTPNETAVPILPSGDVDRSAAFYGYLGFRMLSRTADYLRAVRGEIEIHLYSTAGMDPLANPAGCYLRVAEPEHLRAQWHTDGIPCLDVPVSDAYGPTTFAVIDPDGNTLRIGPAPDRAPTATPVGTNRGNLQP
jgi:catechol 2,3-dioxygenase-like lactoylglutathione lyase family enzyme